MGKLTNITQNKTNPKALTSNINAPFILGFRHKLFSGYTFKELTPENLKEWQQFLNKIADQTVSTVDKTFARKPDKDDTAYGKTMRHYEVTSTFRIHVILED